MRQISTQFLLLVTLAFSATSVAKTNALSEYEHRQLQQVSKAMQSAQWLVAKQQLMLLQQEVRAEYAKTLVAYNLGQTYLGLKQQQAAFDALFKAYQYETLPEQQQQALLKSLIQLAYSNQDINQAVDLTELWLRKASSITAEDAAFISQIYMAAEQWSQALNYAQQAINLITTQAPIVWYQIEVAALVQMQQWQEAEKAQVRLINHYPDIPAQWRQLVAIQLKSAQYKQALASQKIAYEAKLLTEKRDQTLLVQLLLQQGLYYQAGVIVEQAIEQGVESKTAENLKTLGQIWSQSKETEQAIKQLQQLDSTQHNQHSYLLLAQLQMQQMDWSAVQTTLTTAIKQTNNPAPYLTMLAQSYVNSGQIEKAQQYFLRAKQQTPSNKQIDAWLSFITQLNQTPN